MDATQPFGGAYGKQVSHDASAVVSPLSAAGAAIRVAELLP